jgi:hypothetical protein
VGAGGNVGEGAAVKAGCGMVAVEMGLVKPESLTERLQAERVMHRIAITNIILDFI